MQVLVTVCQSDECCFTAIEGGRRADVTWAREGSIVVPPTGSVSRVHVRATLRARRRAYRLLVGQRRTGGDDPRKLDAGQASNDGGSQLDEVTGNGNCKARTIGVIQRERGFGDYCAGRRGQNAAGQQQTGKKCL